MSRMNRLQGFQGRKALSENPVADELGGAPGVRCQLCPNRADRLHARPGSGGDELVRRDSQFGRDDRDFTWERTDKADALRKAAGLSQPATV